VPDPVIGVPDALAVLVLVGEPVTVAVVVAVAVAVAVPVGVVAPSSRKTINGLAHQLIFARACVEGVGVDVAAPLNGLEQALRSRHPRKRANARERP